MNNNIPNLFNQTEQQTMSSREIAEITGKRHDHVLRDVDVLNENYNKLQLPRIGFMFSTRNLPNGGHRKDRYCELTKIQTLDLMTGYSVELRIKVNRRWEELEKKNSETEFEIPTTYSQALRLSADLLEKNENQAKELQLKQNLIDEQTPKVLFADEIGTNGQVITELVKILKESGEEIGEQRLFIHLRENGYLKKLGDKSNSVYWMEPKVADTARVPIGEAADLLGISRETLRVHSNNGFIKCQFNQTTKRRYFTGRELKRYWRKMRN